MCRKPFLVDATLDPPAEVEVLRFRTYGAVQDEKICDAFPSILGSSGGFNHDEEGIYSSDCS
jgi:hypothetical protein